MSSLYIHVPFCRTKCPYCDFFSVIGHSSELTRYPEHLLSQLSLPANRERLRTPLTSVFFGGGTPSLLSPKAVATILKALETQPGIASRAEISLEANPGTINLENLQGYRTAGINRLSLGIQSLNAGFLQRLGRRHSPEGATAAFHLARQAGYTNLSCDLMFGLPGQRRKDLMTDLEALLRLEPEHLSCYGLTIEENTPFQHLHRDGGLLLPEDEAYRELYLSIHDRLVTAGYTHYEISNYARPGHTCRHNLAYWRRQAYLGIGAGAHSFFPVGWGERWSVPPDLARYAMQLEQGIDPARKLESFDRQGAMAETLYLGLRSAEGVSEEDFVRHFGEGVAAEFPAAVARCGRHLTLQNGYWRLNLEGWLIYDHLIEAFL